MDKFDKLKIASSSLGERLKTGGAQMSRIVSSKMKEILQAPTPESKMVDEATLETMEEPNWGLNLRICSMISSEQINGTEVVKAIKKKLLGKSPVSQRLSLDLLETCTSNCEKVFSEVASEKVLDDMMKMIEDPKTDHENRLKAMQLIRAWGESEELMYLPVFQQTYLNLKTKHVPQGTQDSDMPAMTYPLESYLDQGPLSPPESYPTPEMGLHSIENANFVSYRNQSGVDKREFLVETRNSLDVLSSILNSDGEAKSIKSELTQNLLDKCKQSLPVLQRIIETTADDEEMLFECLSLHDDLQQVISRYLEMETVIDSETRVSKQSAVGGTQSAELDAKGGDSSHVQNQNTPKNADFKNSPSDESDSKEPRSLLQIENLLDGHTPKRSPLEKESAGVKDA